MKDVSRRQVKPVTTSVSTALPDGVCVQAPQV
jgi:hypothetical protein